MKAYNIKLTYPESDLFWKFLEVEKAPVYITSENEGEIGIYFSSTKESEGFQSNWIKFQVKHKRASEVFQTLGTV